jgi:alpha-galactosidase
MSDLRRLPRHGSQPDNVVPRSILPVSGWGYDSAPAICVRREGGVLPLRPLISRVDAATNALTFELSDAREGVSMGIEWKVAPSGLFEVLYSITNNGFLPLELLTLASVALPLPDWGQWQTRYWGRWAGEMQQARVPIEMGEQGATSYGGREGFGGGNWVRIEAADVTEEHGRALAAHLAWSGDHYLQIHKNAEGTSMLLMGARVEAGEIVIHPGECWTAPRAVFALSDTGHAGLRQVFHRHVLADTVPAAAAAGPRKVHINTWEAIGFDMEMASLCGLADRAARLGVERFVLDDGWFRGRRSDASSLGDWSPDPAIFPAGLGPLIDHVKSLGMDFGLWLEPEMISPRSELYERYPDWCIHAAGYERPTQRHQLVLDLTRKDVSNYLFQKIDDLLTANTIAYLKWDHNRELFPLAGKGHAQIHALYALLDRLRAAHPLVEIETCASGGGRVDFEILRRCSRFWASDNNDALERLRISSAWADFLPLRVTGNHVGPSPNPITRRVLPIEFRAKVAMLGHMGVEADPASMSAGEKAVLAYYIDAYKEWRETLHRGRLFKLDLECAGVFGFFVLDGDRGLLLAAQTRYPSTYSVPAVKIPGLDLEKRYRVTLIEHQPADPADIYLRALADGVNLSGAALSGNGISLPFDRPSIAWLLSVTTF